MISVESQVLERHLALFQDKSVLFAGGINDLFPQQIQSQAKEINIWSCYFDYVKQFNSKNNKSAVLFSADLTEADFNPQADLIVFYWLKNKQEVQFQLAQLLAQSKENQEILIIGENRAGVRSVEKILAPYGEIAKIDSARRCGLYHFTLKKQQNSAPHFSSENYWKTFNHQLLEDLTIHALAGVFSQQALDTGTELLLSTIDNHILGDVLDLGCGAGVIGSLIKKRNPKANVLMTDIHACALKSAEKTLAENQLKGEVRASDVFSDISEKFDLIISNPPFHDGIDTAYRAVSELISQAKWHLKSGGELRIVANSFLPYPDLLDQHFGSHQVLAKTGKFKVYSVRA